MVVAVLERDVERDGAEERRRWVEDDPVLAAVAAVEVGDAAVVVRLAARGALVAAAVSLVGALLAARYLPSLRADRSIDTVGPQPQPQPVTPPAVA